MRGRYQQLIKALEEGISAVDTYIKSVSQFINMLDDKRDAARFKRELEILKLKNQSILLTLNLIKKIKSKKLSLLNESITYCDSNKHVDKLINIKVNLKNYPKENSNKYINIKLVLKDFPKIKRNKKYLYIRMYFTNSSDKSDYKVINLKLDLGNQ